MKANILTPLEDMADASLMDAECPVCDEVHRIELDCYEFVCNCGVKLTADFMECS